VKNQKWATTPKTPTSRVSQGTIPQTERDASLQSRGEGKSITRVRLESMKIKAYDKYQKGWIYIEPTDDEIWDDVSFSNRGVVKRTTLLFSAIEGDKDNCDPKRWSDLEQFEVVEINPPTS
jgi:hypothetical protein